MTDPKNLSAWYDLCIRIFSDLRGATFQEKKARQRNFRHLFEENKIIHDDYVRFFVEFKYALQRRAVPEIVDQAKERFLQAREAVSPERTLLMMEADALSTDQCVGEETEFLNSVRSYLAVRNSPFGDGSLSGLFWMHIEQENDPKTLIKDCNKALEIINSAFKKLVASYSRLDPTYQLGSSETKGELKT